jgi:hypothetical protein
MKIKFSGFKNSTFRKLDHSSPFGASFKGHTACYENGVKLWGETSPISRLSKSDALRDAKNMAHNFIVQQFKAA